MVKRLGVLGRADMGGVAAQSLSVAQHLGARAALILDLEERGRGPMHLQPWFDAVPEVRVVTQPVSDETLLWLLSESDVVYTVETPGPPGRDDFPLLARDKGVPVFVHANPELFKPPWHDLPIEVILPTLWHADRFPRGRVLPMPVDTNRFPFIPREKARSFLHVAAPAFHDRCGEEIVRAALAHVETPIDLYTRGLSDEVVVEGVANVKVTHLPPVRDNCDLYPPYCDVLLHPRRYGGLSLVGADALALGMPCVTLDLAPLAGRPGVMAVPTSGSATQHMVGGEFPVYDADPKDLARAIDLLANEPDEVRLLSNGAQEWAEENSWTALGETWRKELGL